MSRNEKRLLAIVVILAIFAAAMCSWAVIANLQLKAVRAQLATALENGAASETSAEPVSATGSGEDTAAETKIGTETASTSDEKIAAEFNGGTVTAQEARDEYNTIATYYYANGETEDEFSDELKQTVLETLAEEKILYAKAQELGLTEMSDEQRAAIESQVSSEFEDNVTYYSQFRYDESKTAEEIRNETIEFLNESGLSYDEMLAQAEEGAWRDALYDYAVKDAVLDDATLKEYYDAQVVSDEMTYSVSFDEYEADANAGRAMAWNPEGVRRVDTILIPFDDAQSSAYMDIQAELASGNTEHLDELDALYAELQPKADEVARRIAAGESFDQLSAEYGTLNAGGTYVSDQSTANGDDFRDAAMGMKNIGDTAGPVNVDNGIVFLRYSADIPAGTVAFDDIKEALRADCTEQYKQQVYSDFIAQCMKDADVKYYPENI